MEIRIPHPDGEVNLKADEETMQYYQEFNKNDIKALVQALINKIKELQEEVDTLEEVCRFMGGLKK